MAAAELRRRIPRRSPRCRRHRARPPGPARCCVRHPVKCRVLRPRPFTLPTRPPTASARTRRARAGAINEAPFARIFGNNTALAEPFGIALDVCGNIYVANVPQFRGTPGNNILVFAANPSGSLNEAPVATIPVGGQVSGGIAVDSSGKIYVGITSNTGAIDVFAPVPAAGGTLNEAPLATITGSNTGFSQSVGVIALDASSRIYTASAGGIGIFAANPSGTLNEAPVAMIAGNNTGLESPISISFDPSGNIYVANNLNNSVTVYAANPNGSVNEAPLGTIAGSNTGLSNVQCITVDATGRIYVGNRPLNGASAKRHRLPIESERNAQRDPARNDHRQQHGPHQPDRHRLPRGPRSLTRPARSAYTCQGVAA